MTNDVDRLSLQLHLCQNALDEARMAKDEAERKVGK